jgi:acyl carrier protein
MGRRPRSFSRGGAGASRHRGGPSVTEFERTLLGKIIDHLHLEEIDIDAITPDTVLFGQGLELDSIDAIELEIMIEKNYGISILTSERTKSTFGTLGGLAAFIERNRNRDKSKTGGLPAAQAG